MFYSASTGGFYDPAIHGEAIPGDAVSITRERHAALLAAQADGKRIVADQDGAPIAVDPPVPALAEYKEAAKLRIDLAAGEARARFPSPGVLLTGEYLQSEQAAAAFQAAGYPAGDVPDEVQSWADAGGMSAQVACDDILATAAGWRSVLAAVRRQRLVGKASIDSAADHTAVDAAEADVLAALDTIRPGVF
jgi:branched-subunit amino acid aminotransferase/4-amino-4-deoxychorismate lyase